MSKGYRSLFIAIAAIAIAAAALAFPVMQDSDSSDAAEPSYIRAATIKVYDQDSTEYSDLAYLSDKLPSELSAAEWMRDPDSGLWYNVNTRSAFYGNVLRYGDVSGMTLTEIRSDIAAISPVFTTTSFVLVQVGCEVSGDCNLALEIKKDGTSVKTEVTTASLSVSGCYVTTQIEGIHMYTVADSGADINLVDKAGVYSVILKCNGITASSASTDYRGTVYNLYGSVMDKNGRSISDATISYQITDSEGIPMSEGTYVTDSSGLYIIRSVASTIVNITSVVAEGFTFPIHTYSYGTITGDVYPGMTFVSNEKYIKIIVRDQSAMPAEGVEISAVWYTCTPNGDGTYRIEGSTTGLVVPFDTGADGSAIVTVSETVADARLLIKGMTGSYSFNDVDPIYPTPSTPFPLPDFLSGEGNAYANLTSYDPLTIHADDYSVVITAAGNLDSGLHGGAVLQGVHVSAEWYYQYEDSPNYVIADKDHITTGFENLNPGRAWFSYPYSAQDGTVLLHYTTPTWTPASPSIGEQAYIYIYADGAAQSSPSYEYHYTYALPASGDKTVEGIADMYDTCAAMLPYAISATTLRADEASYTVTGIITGDLPSSVKVYCVSPSGVADSRVVEPIGSIMEFQFTVKSGASSRIEIDDVVGYTFSNQKQTLPSAYSDQSFTSESVATSWLVDRQTPAVLKTFDIAGGSDGDMLTFRFTVAGSELVVVKKVTANPDAFNAMGWTGNIVSAVTVSGSNMYIKWTGDASISVAHMTQIEVVTYYNSSENTPTIDNVIGGQTVQVYCDDVEYSTILTDTNGKANITVPDVPGITFKMNTLAVIEAPVTSGAYVGCTGLNLKDVIDAPGLKVATIDLRYKAISSLQNETEPTSIDILPGSVLELTVGETSTFTAPEIEGFTFSGWFINGAKVSDSRNLYLCNLSVTEDMDGSTLMASYAAETPEPPKEKIGTTVAIGILAVTIAIIAMIYVILQIRRY